MMNEEFNPYSAPQPPFNQQVANPQPQQPQQPPQGYVYQQPVRTDVPQQMPPQQPVAPQNGQPQMPPRYPQPPVFPYPQQPVAPNQSSERAAKGLGVASFIVGCFALVVTSMIFFNFRSSVSDKFAASMVYSILLGVPALILAVISLMKKPEKKIFPLLGLAFSLVLMVCAFITYFVMVNSFPHYY